MEEIIKLKRILHVDRQLTRSIVLSAQISADFSSAELYYQFLSRLLTTHCKIPTRCAVYFITTPLRVPYLVQPARYRCQSCFPPGRLLHIQASSLHYAIVSQSPKDGPLPSGSVTNRNWDPRMSGDCLSSNKITLAFLNSQ